MNKVQSAALGQVEHALALLAASGAKLRGVVGDLFVVGNGKRRVAASYQMETQGVYHDMGETGKEVSAQRVPLWDFDAKQRRAIVGLEAALGKCDEADLCLLGSVSGLLAVESKWLLTCDSFDELQELTEMVQDGGAWKR